MMAKHNSFYLLRLFRRLAGMEKLALVVTLVVVLVSGYAINVLIKRQYDETLDKNLDTVLHAVSSSIDIWASEQVLNAKSFANSKEVQRSVKALLATPMDAEKLMASPAQKELREVFRTSLDNGLFRDFFVVAPNNLNIASSHNERLGIVSELNQEHEVSKLIWSGSAAFSSIQHTDISKRRNERMFIGVPVKSEDGKVMAALALSIEPWQNVYSMMELGRLGESGETYAINRDGVLVSPSRFTKDLSRFYAGEDYLLHLRVADPGVNLLTHKPLHQDLSNKPLTLMARSVLANGSGSNLDGYRDYRGVKVVGKWLWNESLGIGITTEQDYSEAYDLLVFIQRVITFAAALCTFFVILLFLLVSKNRSSLVMAKNRLETVIDNAVAGIVTLTHEGLIESINDAALQMFDYRKDELIGRNISALIPPPHINFHNGDFRAFDDKEQTKIVNNMREVTAKKKDGSLFPIEVGVSRLALEDGQYFVGIIKDLTQHYEMEKKLEQERHFTKNVLDSMDANIAVLDSRGNIVLTNRVWTEFAQANGAKSEFGIGTNYIKVVASSTSADAQAILVKLQAVLSGELDSFQQEYECHSPAQRRWFQMRVNRFIYLEDVAVVISHINVTQRVLDEMQLKAVNSELRITSLVAQNTNNAVIVTDPSRRITWVNQGFIQMSGYSLEESLGKSPGELLQGEYTDRDTTIRVRDALDKRRRVEAELVNYTKSGSEYWVRMEITPVLNEAGELEQFVALEQDITKEKRMLCDLEKSRKAAELERDEQERVNKVLALTSEALNRTGIAQFWFNARTGQLLNASNRACEFLGYSQTEINQLSLWDIDVDRQFAKERFAEVVSWIKDPGWQRFESVHQTKDGRRIPVEITAMYHDQGIEKDPVVITFSVDITSRKESEVELIMSRQEAEDISKTKSNFLAVMSHEIRTPLNGIVGTLDLVNRTALNDKQEDLIATALDSAGVLQSVIDDILDFSKIEAGHLELERVSVSLGPLLESLAASLRHLSDNNAVDLLIYCDPGLPPVIGDPVRIKQVCFNVVGNAIKFSKGSLDQRGQVLVAIEEIGRDAGNIKFSITVTDNGIGMSEDVKARLFVPFSQGEQDTTRRFGGTGLGLVITHRLVSQMGGRLAVDSQVNVGSTFTIELDLEIDESADVNSQQGCSKRFEGIEVLYFGCADQNVDRIFNEYLGYVGARVITACTEHIAQQIDELGVYNGVRILLVNRLDKYNCYEDLLTLVTREAIYADVRMVVLERGASSDMPFADSRIIRVDPISMRRSRLINALAYVLGWDPLEREVRNYERELLSSYEVSEEEAKAAGRFILLVDDNSTNLKVLGQQLTTLGYGVEFAKDGIQALDLLRTKSFNAVLTDCHMPNMDGYQLSQEIRENEGEGPRMPIIAVTADALKGTAGKCFDAGMDAYITKPVQLSSLREVLDKWVERDIKRDKDAAIVSIKPNENAKEAIDRTILAALIGVSDDEVLNEFYQDFLQGSGPTVSAIMQAYAESDSQQIGRLAHKMKSSARGVGAKALADCCEMLEAAGKNDQKGAIAQLIPLFEALFDSVKDWIAKR